MSVPKYATGTNVRALPLPEALAVAESLFIDASAYLPWRCAFEEARVSRVDLVRDFTGVFEPGVLLDGLARVPSRYPASPYRDRRGHVRGLVRGPVKRWRATLYSKYDERLAVARYVRPQRAKGQALADAEAARGRLRFEVGVRSAILSEHGVGAVSGLREGQLAALRRRYWQRAGYGASVAGLHGLVAAVLVDPELSHRERLPALGYLVACGVGAAPVASAPSRRKYGAAGRRLGFTGASSFATVAMRLDYARGELVEVAL